MSLAICEQGYTLTSLNNQHHMSRHELGWRMLQHIGLLLGCRPVCLRYVADLQNLAGRPNGCRQLQIGVVGEDRRPARAHEPCPAVVRALALAPAPRQVRQKRTGRTSDSVNHHAVARGRVCVRATDGRRRYECSRTGPGPAR